MTIPEQPKPVPPPRRKYKAKRYGRPKMAAQDQLMNFGYVFMGGGVGLILGMLLEAFWGVSGGSWKLTILGGALGWAVGRLVVGAATGSLGAALNPSGSSTPQRADYSKAQALTAQGRFGEAAQAYEIACLESSGDPEPYFRLGRLYRDQLNQPEEALAWFRRARTDADITPGQELVAIQEIIELYMRKLGTPRKAIPELMRLCDRFPGTPAADAAAKELGKIREMLDAERDGLEPFTAQFLKKIGRDNA